MIEQLEEVKDELKHIFPRALAVLEDSLNQEYDARVAELDAEAAALAVEYAEVSKSLGDIEKLMPSQLRLNQYEIDKLVVDGRNEEARAKTAELEEAQRIPAAMEQRQREISDRYDAIPAEKVAIAHKLYEQMYPEMQEVVRLGETGYFIGLLDGLAKAAADFQQKTGSAQNPMQQLNRMMALTADGKSPEWAAAQRWYQSRR